MKWLSLLSYVLYGGFQMVQAQQVELPVPIGSWKTYLPYNGPVQLAFSGDKVYAANGLSVFSYHIVDESFDRLHKANVLNDVNAIGVYAGGNKNALAITYLNSNIDFIIEGKNIAFPFIQSSNLSGDKSVRSVSFRGDSAYIATGFGIVVYNTQTLESPATYFFTDPLSSSPIAVNQVLSVDNTIYAATSAGLYKASASDPLLEDFSKWELWSGTAGLPAGEMNSIVLRDGRLYALIEHSAIYEWDGTEWLLYVSEADWDIRFCGSSENFLQVILTQGDDLTPTAFRLMEIDTEGSITEFDIELQAPVVMRRSGDKLWIADAFGGLVSLQGDLVQQYIPNGPGSSGVFDMEYYENRLWVAPGAYNASWNYLYNRDGFFVMDFGFWNNYNRFSYPLLDTIFDIVTLTSDAGTGKTWMGSFGGGVLEFDKNTGQLNLYDENNTGATGLQDIGAADPGNCRIGGMQVDVNGHLWISNHSAPNPLVVKTAEGLWQHFDCGIPGDLFNRTGAIVIDDFDQKWVQIARGGGILVYNHGTDVLDAADDQKRLLGVGAGNGNLPVIFVNALVKDLDGEIWVGTNEGVTVFYNPGSVLDGGTIADAAQPLVNLGGYNEFLLSKEIVNCLAVDGGNRKWIGTNSGVFLISEDGTQQLAFFNQSNSPLLSNVVLKITIDGATGEVFFGTDKGIVSYRGEATQGLAEHTAVKVFPNPVRPEYTGPIAISGLVNNAQVKITDTGGRLVYEAVALGGQVVWDGFGYEGRRASTGVYLVYSADDTGKEQFVTKIVFIQ